MTVGIAGLGWVTPLGGGLEEVWQRVHAGESGTLRPLVDPESGRAHPFMPVPETVLAPLARCGRLRRSSPISYLAVAAGLAALQDAGVEMTPAAAASTALVFAVGNGGVLYTRRFHEQIQKEGASAASPLLFPETVYNAPASHLAALVGVDGATYTLVGDSSIGLSALHFAAELLSLDFALEQVVVVGAEEGDWIICEGYRQWRLARCPLAEGAGAIVLRRSGRWQLQTHPGEPFWHQREATACLEKVLANFSCGEVNTVITSANGTFVDAAEAAALRRFFPKTQLLPLKRAFGEAPGASALCQTVAAALAVEHGAAEALVSVVGINQHAAAALVRKA